MEIKTAKILETKYPSEYAKNVLLKTNRAVYFLED